VLASVLNPLFIDDMKFAGGGGMRPAYGAMGIFSCPAVKRHRTPGGDSPISPR